ncbi:putative cyclin-dependent kinase regulatory subunit protein [Botrytis fragariae]|uniref:Cyclin-dependent kinases regulatory subunit n=1 Tax=Botrytis fragariae TaxID=1964551 RepID=A0A8H6AJL2_9HELO|nr:putative cyclin-dependent kinase regulatory subunit protein [Botrytis fragariae]KAF5868856.1 putative cyclin-dependent kinase regulatory subunit protein [Botrytis fragariae]
MAEIDYTRRNKYARPLSEAEKERLDEFIDAIHYSARSVQAMAQTLSPNPSIAQTLIHSYRYSDDQYEYRHVQLPKAMLKVIPKEYHDPQTGTLKLLWEEEWRALGITQSLGWEHYEVHEPEPHILLFKRSINYQPPTQQ